MSNRFDHLLRRTNVAVLNGAVQLSGSGYAYDPASRLSKVTSGVNSAGYSYLANSALVEQIEFAQDGTPVMRTTNSFDALNRLTKTTSRDAQGNVLFSTAYQLNSANQRAALTNAENAVWIYAYDKLGQVISGRKYWPDGKPVAGQQFDYAFDEIGNRTTAASGGDQNGANLRYQAYSANSVNQYTSRTMPGFAGVVGSANSNATVTLWGDDGAYAGTIRQGERYFGELPVNNSTGPVWLTVTNVALLRDGANGDIVTNVVGSLFVPRSPEVLGYDLDGNLTNDGRWSYTWDCEGRLLSVERVAVAPAASKVRVQFDYDWQWRRTRKITYTNYNGSYVAAYTNLFVYDGWNLVAILGPDKQPLQSFAWGTDLSGTMQGAGGVGGLLSMTVHAGANAGTYVYCFDGNGNVVGLVSAANGDAAAEYEYSPFGELLRATGLMAEVNPFQFSTKYRDDETGLVYYGYRYYDPSTGNWVSRDPMLEFGGINVYSVMGNNPIASIDPDGRYFVRSENKLTLVCGGWRVDWWYEGTVPRKGRYFLVQEIVKVRRLNDCCEGVEKNEDSHWWEARDFPVEGTDWTLVDRQVVEPDFDTSAGVTLVSGEGRVFPADEDIARDIAAWGRVPEAKDMPATRIRPTWWDIRFIDAGHRSAWSNDWDCCSKPRGFGTVHTNP